MRKMNSSFRSVLSSFALLVFLSCFSQPARAASWKGLEPFVSKRADVERVLGRPVADKMRQDSSLQFSGPEGTITVFFVTPKFIAAKKLPPELEGTVLQIIIQHTGATTDTAESLKLATNPSFEHDDSKGVEVFKNAKDGLSYTFMNGRLKTTRYYYSVEQTLQLQKEK